MWLSMVTECSMLGLLIVYCFLGHGLSISLYVVSLVTTTVTPSLWFTQVSGCWSALVKCVYYVSSCNLKRAGLIANIIRLELHYVQNIKLDIIGIEKNYVVWSTNQSILIKHSTLNKDLLNPCQTTDAS